MSNPKGVNYPIILFDGVCNFCNRMVNFAIRNDKKGKLKFAPLQSEAGLQLKEQCLLKTANLTLMPKQPYASPNTLTGRPKHCMLSLLYHLLSASHFINGLRNDGINGLAKKKPV